MKYLLLKNGQTVSREKVITGDILIGNNRVMQIGGTIRIPSPSTLVIDVDNKFLLPGLIHYNCPFLKSENKEPTASSIYAALSQGATFLMDTLRLKKESSFKNAIEMAKEGSKPIITDYSLHLGASACCKVSSRDLNYGFIHEGITSYYIKWKHIEKLSDGQLDHLLSLAAKFKLLMVCETTSIKQTLFTYDKVFLKSYLEKMDQLVSIIRNTGCPFLFLDITMEDELNTLFTQSQPDLPVYASVNLDCANEKADGRLSASNIDELWQNRNIILSPPKLESPNPILSQYTEHGKSPSFLMGFFSGSTNVSKKLLVKVCEMYGTRPAKLLGVYPQKGTIEPGADADIIVWNPIEPDRSKTSGSNTSLLKKDISALIVNGEVITEDQITPPTRFNGKFIHRSSLVSNNPITAKKAV